MSRDCHYIEDVILRGDKGSRTPILRQRARSAVLATVAGLVATNPAYSLGPITTVIASGAYGLRASSLQGSPAVLNEESAGDLATDICPNSDDLVPI